MDVLVLGSANADLIVRVERRPGPGETVLGSDTEVLPGGKGANAAVAAGRPAGVHTVLNLAPAARLDLSAVDTLVLNRHEAAWLLNSPWEDTRLLLELGPRSVVVTLGAHGVLLHTKDRSDTVGAPKVEAVDTTGAGDAFTGALATGLAAGRDLLAAAELA